MEVCSSVEYPHQSGFPQTRHRRCLVTLQKPFVVCRCCCRKLPTVDCLVLIMWTDIYPRCCDFQLLLHLFRPLFLEDEFPLTPRFFRRVLSFGFRLIFRVSGWRAIAYDFRGGRLESLFRVLPKTSCPGNVNPHHIAARFLLSLKPACRNTFGRTNSSKAADLRSNGTLLSTPIR